MGGGIEYAFTNNVTVKIEGLYVNFDRNNRNNNGFFGGGNVVGVTQHRCAGVRQPVRWLRLRQPSQSRRLRGGPGWPELEVHQPSKSATVVRTRTGGPAQSRAFCLKGEHEARSPAALAAEKRRLCSRL